MAIPIALQMHAEGRWDVIPNAEPAVEFEARVRGGIERIAAAHPDQLVVAVVHGGVIGQVINIAVGTTGFAFTGADNASISHLVVTSTAGSSGVTTTPRTSARRSALPPVR